ncbi:MAG TPA: hypothetical protein VJ247_00110 [Gaiella sp.]|jgi:hypothetical protein|nr:hypothetical protein [Gaiella sp.]
MLKPLDDAPELGPNAELRKLSTQLDKITGNLGDLRIYTVEGYRRVLRVWSGPEEGGRAVWFEIEPEKVDASKK